MFKSSKLTVAIVSVSLALGGCAVSPEPIDRQTILDTATLDQELIYASQEPLNGAMSLEEAMARALKYNLESRLQLMQEALSDSSYALVKMDMLPILAASAGYNDRSNVDASRSFNIITQTENFSYSTSQDLEYETADVRFAWNILDFGVSYYQAKQESDRFLVSGMGRQRVKLRLLEQVRGSYWRAVAMQSIAPELADLLSRSRQSLAQLQQSRAELLNPPLTTLQELRSLIELVQQLEALEQSVNNATIQLATLTNVAPGTQLNVELPAQLPQLPELSLNVEDMELTALANSTDYTSELYNLRIDQLESRKSLMRLLPGLEFSYTKNYLSNSYLYNDNWGMAGLRLTGNLMRLLAYDEIKDVNEAREQFGIARRLTMNMAVVTQLHLSWQQYANTLVRLDRAEELDEVDQAISVLADQTRASNAISGNARIQAEARALRSKMSALMSYADAQTSLGAFLNSMSLDPVPVDYQTLGVSELADLLDQQYSNWEQGNLPLINAIELDQHSEEGQGDLALLDPGAAAEVVALPIPAFNTSRLVAE